MEDEWVPQAVEECDRKRWSPHRREQEMELGVLELNFDHPYHSGTNDPTWSQRGPSSTNSRPPMSHDAHSGP